MILQNLERKLTNFETYIAKQASALGASDPEARALLKRYEHENFSGGLDTYENYKLSLQKQQNRVTNVVEEN